MHEEILITRGEDEAASELHRILAQAMLAVAAPFGAASGPGIVAAHQVEKAGRAQSDSAIGGPVGIDEKWEPDARLFAEGRGVSAPSEAYRRNLGPGGSNLLLVVAQLRDMLAAEDSAVVAQEHDHGGLVVPEITEAVRRAVGIRQLEIAECRTVGSIHGATTIPGGTPVGKPRASASDTIGARVSWRQGSKEGGAAVESVQTMVGMAALIGALGVCGAEAMSLQEPPSSGAVNEKQNESEAIASGAVALPIAERVERLERAMWWNHAGLVASLGLEDSQRQEIRSLFVRYFTARLEGREQPPRPDLFRRAVVATDLARAREMIDQRAERAAAAATADARIIVDVLGVLRDEQLERLSARYPRVLRAAWFTEVSGGRGRRGEALRRGRLRAVPPGRLDEHGEPPG